MESITSANAPSPSLGLLFGSSVPTTVRIAQCVGITSAGFLLGQTATLSTIAIPAFMEAPAPVLSRQWKKMFSRTHIVGPALTVFTSLAWGFLASREYISSSTFKLYAAAACTWPAVTLYTWTVMMPINRQFLAESKSMAEKHTVDIAAEANTHALVDQWATRNMGRVLIMAVCSTFGVWATLNKEAVLPRGVGRFV